MKTFHVVVVSVERGFSEAQQAYLDSKQWVNYFLHSGHLNIAGLKMSKSLKNFIQIDATLERFTARQLRLLFLNSKYNATMHYSEEGMTHIVALDRTFAEFFRNLKVELREARKEPERSERWDAAEKELAQTLVATQTEVRLALCDDLDTPRAMRSLLGLVNATNRSLSDAGSKPAPSLLMSIGRYLTGIFRIFGLVNSSSPIGFGDEAGSGGEDRETVLAPVLDALTEFRERVRNAARTGDSAAVLQACDDVRDRLLPPAGVRIEDADQAGARWKLVDPGASLCRERDFLLAERW